MHLTGAGSARFPCRSGALGLFAVLALLLAGAVPPYAAGPGSAHACPCCGAGACTCGPDSSCGCRPRLESAGVSAAPAALLAPLVLVPPLLPPPAPARACGDVRALHRPSRRPCPDVPPPKRAAGSIA